MLRSRSAEYLTLAAFAKCSCKHGTWLIARGNKRYQKGGTNLMEPNELLANLDKLHTTELGVLRIKNNLSLDTSDVVKWCCEKVRSQQASITRKGKNWYVSVDSCIITINAHSYTIITAHKEK